MYERVAKLASLVDRAWRFRGYMAGNSIRPTELAKEPLDAVLVPLDVRIDLRLGTFKIGVGHKARSAVAGADDIEHIEVALADQPIPMHI